MLNAKVYVTLKKGVLSHVTDLRGADYDNKVSKWDQLDTLEKSLNEIVNRLDAYGDDAENLAEMGLIYDDKETPSPDDPSNSLEKVQIMPGESSTLRRCAISWSTLAELLLLYPNSPMTSG